MNDFKKGLLVGMLIIIGCGTFIASSSNDDVGRYIAVGKDELSLLDTKTGTSYRKGGHKRWIIRASISKDN